MAQDVKIRVTEQGAEQTANKLGKVDKSIQNMASSALKFGAAYFSTQGLINGLKKSIELAGIQEAAEKKLSTALGRTSKELLTYASALQQQTTYGDEAIIEAQSLIAAFTNEEDQIKELTRVTLDLAAAKGIDLKSAADLVAKSFGTSTNALARYGVEVTGAAGSTERLEQLTQGLTDLYGGQASAAADTMAGSIDQMNNAIGDVFEAIGQSLSPAIISMTGEITSSAVEFTNFLAINRSIVNEVGSGWEELSAKVKVSLIEQKIALLENAKEMTYGGTMYKALEALGHVTGNYTLAIGYAGEKTDEYTQEISKLREQAEQLTQTDEYKNEVLQESIALNSKNLELMAAETEIVEYISELYLESFEARSMALESYSSGYKLSAEEQAIITQELIDFETELYNAQFDQQIALEGAKRLEARKTAEEQLRLDQMKIASNASVVANALGALAQLSSGNSKAAKITARLMQAQAIVDTYAGANRALATGIPPFSYIAAAATIAVGLANVSRIQSQAFEKGGIVAGTSYTGDNVPARVNSGEMILNKQQQSELFKIANGGGGGGITIQVQGNLVASEQEADRFAEIIAKRSKQGFNRLAVN